MNLRHINSDTEKLIHDLSQLYYRGRRAPINDMITNAILFVNEHRTEFDVWRKSRIMLRYINENT